MLYGVGCAFAVLTSSAFAINAVTAHLLRPVADRQLEEAVPTSSPRRILCASPLSSGPTAQTPEPKSPTKRFLSRLKHRLLHVCDSASDPAKYGYSDGEEFVRKPVQERMALLLRGESFHQSHRKQSGCVLDMYEFQLRAAQSLMDQIVFPAERQQIPVDIFVTDRKGCDMLADELAIFRQGAARSVATKLLTTKSHASAYGPASNNQATNMREALEWFKQEAGGIDAVQNKYSLVVVTRHDLIWRSPFDSWPTANLSNFNFLSKGAVMEKETINGDFQVNDVFHMMPGRVFPAFDAAVGTGACFNPEVAAGSGHGCMCDMSKKVRSDHISFVTPERPTHGVHDNSSVVMFPWGPMSLIVRDLAGEDHELELEQGLSIGDVKSRIRELIGIHVVDLVLDGKKLDEDEDTLDAAGMHDGSVLDVVCKADD